MNEINPQDSKFWTKEWSQLKPEDEIKIWDYYGIRPYVLKYTPRFGKVVEAGSGLGRFVFLLEKFGIDIEGLDFSESTVNFLNIWKQKYGFNSDFIVGDVKKTDYPHNFLSGYLSFGVMEHFIEGPQKPLLEAYRILRPGGIAIITTPNKSFFYYYSKFYNILKRFLRALIGYENKRDSFVQYHFHPRQLKKFIEAANLFVTRYNGDDLFYMFCQFGGWTGNNLKERSFAYWFSHKFQKSFLSRFGAKSITISVKVADLMYCFFCNELKAVPNSLNSFEVPICDECQTNNSNSMFYLKNSYCGFNSKYLMNPKFQLVQKVVCTNCKSEYYTDELFENFGLTMNICQQCLKNKDINIRLSNLNLLPIWRKRQSLL